MSMILNPTENEKKWGVDMWRVYQLSLQSPARMPELLHIYERYVDEIREHNTRNHIDAYVGMREQETIDQYDEFAVFDYYLNKYMFFRIVEFDKRTGEPRIKEYNSPFGEVW